MSANKRPKFEVIMTIIIAVISLSGSYLYAKSRSEARVEKAYALKSELGALRGGVLLFRAVERRNPSSLPELVKGTFNLGDGERRYVHVFLNEKGSLEDPFGKPYRYNVKTGWIRSITQDYESW